MANSNKSHLHHVAIQTANFERAFHFYTELLGLRVIKKPFCFKGKRTLTWLDTGSILLELYSVKKGVVPEQYSPCRLGADHIAFEVYDVDKALSQLEKNGYNILKPPFVPVTDDPKQPRVAFIEGPDNEEIEIREKGI